MGMGMGMGMGPCYRRCYRLAIRLPSVCHRFAIRAVTPRIERKPLLLSRFRRIVFAMLAIRLPSASHPFAIRLPSLVCALASGGGSPLRQRQLLVLGPVVDRPSAVDLDP